MSHKLTDRVYRGTRNADGSLKVMVVTGAHKRPLPLRLGLDNHSPTGFENGYGGSGPAQLALAILADALGTSENETARRLHQKYKWAVISKLPRDADWEITRESVVDFCCAI